MDSRKILTYALKLGLVVVAFIFIFRPEWLGFSKGLFGDVNPRDVWEVVRNAFSERPAGVSFWLTFAVVVKLIGITCGVIRWRLLLHGQGLKLPMLYMFYLWFTGRAIGLFLPGTLGLDGFRLVESSRYTGDWIKCSTVIAVEKLIGLLCLVLLVFLTLPLGLQMLDFNLAFFGVLLFMLFCMAVVSLVLLLNPRIIQVLVAVLPVPGRIRHTVNRLGAAATAYSTNRRYLVLAIFFGLMVHVGTCMTYFGTMMALRAPNADILDILFISPLIIAASVLTPTISGLGVREIIGGGLLGPVTGFDYSVAVFHLGLWAQEIIPYALSTPLLLFGGRPSRAKLQAGLEELRGRVAEAPDVALHLTPEQTTHYARGVYGTLVAGALAGMAAGAVIAMAESLWLYRTIPLLSEFGMFWWGPLAYGVLFGGLGLGISAALLFLYLLFNRFATWAGSYAVTFAGTLLAGGMVIGLFRLQRDVAAGHGLALGQMLALFIAVAGAAMMIGVIAYGIAWLAARMRPLTTAVVGLLVFAAVAAVSAITGGVLQPRVTEAAALPQEQAAGPNIVFIAIDTLRADYLRLWDETAEAETPHFEAFAEDAIAYDLGLAQASWTKPSFATLFTGLYPEAHGATSKTAALPEEADTVAEKLLEAGYYTQGFANNPNISALFNFAQGHSEYVELKPDLYFGAGESASKLSMYEVLRRLRQQFKQQLGKVIPPLRKIAVTDFYQPAEEVTERALEWLEEGRPAEHPFYLFVHYMDPHDPFMDPDAPQGGYARVRMEHPDPDEFREPMRQAYIREIEHLDQYLGDFLEGLKAMGLYEDSLIVLTADHGEEFYDHKGWWHGKTLYQEQTHVPLMIKLPENVHAGARNPYIARHIDLAPTMLRFAGAEASPEMAGQALFDDALEFANQDITFSYAENDFEGNVLHAVQTPQRKLILANPDNPRGLDPVELYNMAEDPKELENLADEPTLADEEAELRMMIENYHELAEQQAPAPQAEVKISGDAAAQLEALGYLGD